MAIDKRVVKTKRAITTAFMELAREKDLNKISVSDIAERAVINRSTFYLHYADATDVLNEIERDISEAICECFSQFDNDNIPNSIYNVLIKLIKKLDETPAFKNFMLYSSSSAYITSNVKKTLTAKAMQATSEHSAKAGEERVELAINFIVSGIMDTYIRWADSGRSSYAAEDFCGLITRLTEAVVEVIR